MKNLNARYAGVMDYAIKQGDGPNKQAALAREGVRYSWESRGFGAEYDKGWFIAGMCERLAKEDWSNPSDLPISELMEALAYGAKLSQKGEVAA